MKRIMKTRFLMILLAAGLLASCSEEDNPVGKFNGSGELIVDIRQPVSTEDFNRCAVGYGWREAETHEIMNDGTVATKDYWEGMIGGGPSSYEFGDGKATLFVYMDAYPADVHLDYTMQYDETTGKVYFDDKEAFTVLAVSPEEIRIVKWAGVRGGDNTKIYLYIVLQRLTDEQLQKVKEIYTTTKEDLDNWFK